MVASDNDEGLDEEMEEDEMEVEEGKEEELSRSPVATALWIWRRIPVRDPQVS